MNKAAQPPAKFDYEQVHDEIDLGYLLALCWDRRIAILLSTALATLIGIIHAWTASPIYEANALLQVEKRQAGVGEEVAFLMGREEAASSTQAEILKSRLVLGQAAEIVGLDLQVDASRLPLIGHALVRHGIRRPGFAKGWSAVWAGETIEVEGLEVEEGLHGETLQLKVLEGGRYSLEQVGGGALGEGAEGETLHVSEPFIDLKVASLDAPPGAEFFLTKRSPIGAARNLQSRFDVTERGRDSGILELSLTGEDQEEITRSLDAITQVYLVQNINRQAAEAESRLQFLEEQAPRIQQNLTQSEDQLNRYRADQASVDLSFETKSLLERLVALEAQLNDLRMKEAELAQRFTVSHPSYATLLEKMAQLERERLRVEALVENLPEMQQQVLRLNRDVEVTQQIYMQILNSMQELRIARAGTIGNVRILDPALVAPAPIAPRRKLIVLSSFLAGLGLGLLYVALQKMRNKGVESVDQLRDIGLSVYATVPLSGAQKSHGYGGFYRSKMAAKNSLRHRKRSVYGPELLAWSNPADQSVEALRSLRTSLHFAMLEAPNNCLMLTGPTPSVGKSFITTNLSAVCAKAGQRVLLVDADLRKGHIHHSFQDKNQNGLSELLVGKTTLDEAIRPTVQEGLDFIPRGKFPPNPSELLMHKNFQAFLKEANSRYDLVVVDTPPVLSVTDAAIVGVLAGTVLMVLRYQTNPVKEVERAVLQLENAGVSVKGVILNAIEYSAAGSYGYGRYHYSYE